MAHRQLIPSQESTDVLADPRTVTRAQFVHSYRSSSILKQQQGPDTFSSSQQLELKVRARALII